MVNVNSLGNGGAVHQRRKAIKSAAKGKQHRTAVQTAIFKPFRVILTQISSKQRFCDEELTNIE